VPATVIKNRIPEKEIKYKDVKDHRTPVKFGVLGSFRPKKGGDLLLNALDYLKQYSADLHLHIWGKIPEDTAVEISRLKNSFIIMCYGHYDRQVLNEIFEKIDVLVYPSCSGDTYPLVLLEALASRTPIIAAKTHGMAEIVQDDWNGKSFEPLNSESLATAMRFFAEDIKKVGQIQQNIAPPLPYGGLVDKTVRVYEELTGKS
jgi:glycosyltransferase involved in cell wall biosynthesis